MGETGEFLNSDMTHNHDSCSEVSTFPTCSLFRYTLEHLNSIKSSGSPVHCIHCFPVEWLDSMVSTVLGGS